MVAVDLFALLSMDSLKRLCHHGMGGYDAYNNHGLVCTHIHRHCFWLCSGKTGCKAEDLVSRSSECCTPLSSSSYNVTDSLENGRK